MIYLEVSLLNDSVDKSTAEIVPRQTEYGVYPVVYSKNQKMKKHLEKLLMYEAFIPAPGLNTNNFFSDSVLELQPNTIYYFNALPEILSWRGYNARVVNKVHKSFDYDEFNLDVFKSVDGEAVKYNSKGERVVKYVPKGYVAVHSDGRVVGGGKYLNANIDKEGTNWTLVENPHEGQTQAQRSQQKDYMEAGLQEYHPGIEEGVYQKRSSEDDKDYHVSSSKYTPKGKTLEEHFKVVSSEPLDEVPSDIPAYLEPGNVVYSPQTGQAFDSKFWPPKNIDYKNHDWYVFEGSKLSDEEKSIYASISGLSPSLIPGVQEGFVNSEKDLDVSEGIKLKVELEDRMGELPDDLSGVVPREFNSPKLEVKTMVQDDWLESYKKAKNALKKFTQLTKEKIDPSLESMEVRNLTGLSANFSADLYPYQKAIVSAMTTTDQYEVFGGPKGWHGYFLNIKMGLGKTAMVAAANAVMRNRGLIKDGKQTTIVTAPNKNLHVWQSEIGKFLGEHAVIIEGGRQDRIDQWEDLVKKAAKNELPPFVILGSSQFRYVRGDSDDNEEDAWELGVDAKYMKLLSLGGESSGVPVEGNHVGIFCVDESAQYVNPETSRHASLNEIIDSVYNGKGIVWTLNGNISGNSSTDTISDLSFINKFVRDNFMSFVQEYTKTNREVFRESKALGRRVWKNFQAMKDFLYTFGPQVYSLDGMTVAGDNYGLKRTEDNLTPLGEEWGSIYYEAERKLSAAASSKEMGKSFGLLSILINSGFGAISPQRLMEYDIGNSHIMKGMSNFLSGEDLDEFREKYSEYLDKVSDSSVSVGRLPKKGISIAERDSIYKSVFSPTMRSYLNRVISSWECPLVTSILYDIKDELQQNYSSGKNMKMGIAGFSKQAINRIASDLRDLYPSDRFIIQVVDGDTSSEDVGKIQDIHQNEKDKHVITLVTGAGLYGLSLPSSRSWRFPTWNSSKGSQYEGRFHRKAEQKNVTTVVLPEGIVQYMRELELMKGSMAEAATNVLLEVDDSKDELAITSKSMTRLMDKMRQYRPRVIGGG